MHVGDLRYLNHSNRPDPSTAERLIRRFGPAAVVEMCLTEIAEKEYAEKGIRLKMDVQ
ncbi:MAG: hypothetical protein ACUVQH_08285 [Thermogutta sp.]